MKSKKVVPSKEIAVGKSIKRELGLLDKHFSNGDLVALLRNNFATSENCSKAVETMEPFINST